MDRVPDWRDQVVENPTTFFSTRDKFMETYEPEAWWEEYFYTRFKLPYNADHTNITDIVRYETVGEICARARQYYKEVKYMSRDTEMFGSRNPTLRDALDDIAHWEKQPHV